MNRRVLFVLSTGLVTGGVPNVTMQIVEHLKNDFTFDVLVPDLNPAVYDEIFMSSGGNIYRINKVSYKDNKFSIIINGNSIYRTVLDLCKKNKYDVIHCENGFESGPALCAAYKAGVPIRISHAHGTYLIKGKNFIANMYKYVCKRAIDRYSTIRIACSQKAGKSLFYNQFKNVLNPIDTDYYAQIKKQPHNGINILQIGYFCKLKNQLFSLNVLHDLEKFYKEVNLFFIGFETESGYLDKMMQYVQDNELENKVFFLDAQTPKTDIMPIIDFLLLPSTNEGLPLTVLEAQAANILALVSNVVTREVDLGLCSFLPITDTKQWVNTILGDYEYEKSVDISLLQRFSKSNYLNSIKNIYNGGI